MQFIKLLLGVSLAFLSFSMTGCDSEEDGSHSHSFIHQAIVKKHV